MKLKTNLCATAWAVALLGATAFGRADMSVLKSEIAQAPEMAAAMDAYLATGSRHFKKPLRVVYFCPMDVEPFDDYQARIERMMLEMQAFFEKEMARNGFPGKSLNLEMADRRLKIHLVRGRKPTADYDYKSGGAIKREVSEEFQRRQMRFGQEHVLIISALAEVTEPYTVRLYAPYYGLGANQASGLCFVADCPWMDPLLFSNTQIKVYVGEHNGRRRMTLGKYNTIYIGGAIHELGHGMSLPHNRERGFEKPVLGRALMGAGNYTYRQELRQEGKGTFLSFASATRLASQGLFNNRVKGLDTTPVCDLAEVSFSYKDDAIWVAGRVETDVPAYAVIAYNDPDGGSDYDAVTWTCAVKPDGTFSVAVRDLLPGSLDLRLAVCHANGAVSVFSNPYTCSENGVPDVERLGLPWLLRDARIAYAEGNRTLAKSKAEKLLREHGKRGITSRYLNHLIELCSENGPYKRPSALNRSQRSAMLSDCRWESARVGWRHPMRNEYARDGKDDTRIFLELGDTFHPKGLYAHSPSSYRFDLGGKWKTFETSYGLQRGARGKVVFGILADGKEVFRSKVVEGSEERAVELNVRGVKSLELVVENGGEGNGNCWSIWGAPRVSR